LEFSSPHLPAPYIGDVRQPTSSFGVKSLTITRIAAVVLLVATCLIVKV